MPRPAVWNELPFRVQIPNQVALRAVGTSSFSRYLWQDGGRDMSLEQSTSGVSKPCNVVCEAFYPGKKAKQGRGCDSSISFQSFLHWLTVLKLTVTAWPTPSTFKRTYITVRNDLVSKEEPQPNVYRINLLRFLPDFITIQEFLQFTPCGGESISVGHLKSIHSTSGQTDTCDYGLHNVTFNLVVFPFKSMR